MYWGYAQSSQTASAGSTSGFTYASTGVGNLVTSNVALSPSTSYAPTASESPAGTNTSIAAIFAATPAYSVTFNGNGSTGGSMANEIDNTSTALTANAFTRTGYSFAGWNTVSTGIGGTSYADGALYPFGSSTTLYAQWTQSTTLSAVGNFASTTSGSGAGVTTANATLSHPGDLLVIWVKALFQGALTPIDVTSISGSGIGAIGTPAKAIQYYTVDHLNNDDEIWYVPVTTAGTITLTFT